MSAAEDWSRYLAAHPEAAGKLRALTLPHLSRYVSQVPTPKQLAALLLPHRAILWGGAAGGGKSSWLLMGALQYADSHGAALVVRRQSINLTQPGALIPRSHEWLSGTDAHWRGDEKTWIFPSGFRLKFGHMEHELDKHNYQSAEYDTVCFEELTEFTESQFRYVFSRQRRPAGSTRPIRTLAATNPGNVGHDWVARCWGLGDYEGQASERDWAFLPAVLEDNPHVDREDYLRSLAYLPEHERQQLRHGDWKHRPKGNKFKVDRIKFCNPDEVPNLTTRWRIWDLAATEWDPVMATTTKQRRPDATAGARGGMAETTLYVEDLRHFRKGPGGVQAELKAAAEADGPAVQIGIEQEPGSSGKTVIENFRTSILSRFAVEAIAATGAKRTRWLPFEAAMEQGRVVFVRGAWNQVALDEMRVLTTDEAQDTKNHLHDDIVDAMAGLYNKLSGNNGDWLAAMMKG